jgi:hypothetical protein
VFHAYWGESKGISAGMPRTAAAAPHLHPPASTGYQCSHPSHAQSHICCSLLDRLAYVQLHRLRLAHICAGTRPQDVVLRALAETAGLCAGDFDEFVRSDEAMLGQGESACAARPSPVGARLRVAAVVGGGTLLRTHAGMAMDAGEHR